jgi:hypothetical protein
MIGKKPTLVVTATRPYETVHGIQCATEDCAAILELSYVASTLSRMPADHEVMSTAIASAATALRWILVGDDWRCPAHQEAP